MQINLKKLTFIFDRRSTMQLCTHQNSQKYDKFMKKFFNKNTPIAHCLSVFKEF